MAIDIRGQSEACWNKLHEQCKGKNCYCECHQPEDSRSLRWKLRELVKSTLPDSERLQVLIHLVAELENRR